MNFTLEKTKKFVNIKEKLEGKHGKNKVDIDTDEHVVLTEKIEIALDPHGMERKFPYKIDSESKENYPTKVIK